MDKDEQLPISGAAAADFATDVFLALFAILEKKGVLSMKEIGEELVRDADDVQLQQEKDQATVLYLRELGKALVRVSDEQA